LSKPGRERYLGSLVFRRKKTPVVPENNVFLLLFRTTFFFLNFVSHMPLLIDAKSAE
jgi:hypothetical protein